MRSARVLLALAYLSLGARLDAQSLFVGFRAGQATAVQYWHLRFFDSGKTARRQPSVTSGITATLDLKSWIAVESDLMYVEKGSRFAFGPTDEMRIGYIEMPVLLRLAVPAPIPGLQMFLHGGPAPAIEVSCAGSPVFVPGNRAITLDIFGPSPGTVTRRCDVRRETKRDFGWVTGGGLLLRRPDYQISISRRRTKGVRDLFPDDGFQERFNDARAFLVSVTARAK
jgi:hypothetical protein